MSLKAVRFYLINIFILLFLVACSSGSTDDSGTTVTGTSGRISLTLMDQASSEVNKVAAGTVLTLRVRLNSANGLAVSGHEVSFNSNAGTVSAASRLTDSNGIAEITLNTTGLTPSVVTVTASTTYQGEALSVSSQFEIEQAVLPRLAVNMSVNGVTSNRFRVGQEAKVSVTVQSNAGAPIANTLVSFTASKGTLTPDTALTDNNGVAETTLTAVAEDLGGAALSASVTIDGQAVTINLPYEVLEQEAAVFSLSVLDQSNTEVTSITEGNALTIIANLVTSTGNAVEQQAINFTATAGTFSASSRLTTSTGLATVTYDSTSVEAGVVTVTATTNYENVDLTVSKQFEVLQALVETQSPELALSFKKDGSSTNRIQAGESAQISVELTSANNQPMVNSIVNFTADLGTLAAPSALTDANGIAEVTVTGEAGQLGAGLATASTTINNVNITNSIPYEVVSSNVVEQSLKLGYLDDAGNYQPGIKSKLTNSNAESTISAGGTLGLELAVFDQDDAFFTSPLTVTFTSTCVTSSSATIDGTVTTINGRATATFEDISCASAFGNEDTVVATVTVNTTDLTATHNINIQPERLGSIEFVSAEPSSIVIKGTGGQGKQETSTLTFQVKGELNNPLSQQTVNFKLNTDIGGLALASTSGVTNSEGRVSAKVISGSVPSAVRVTASAQVDGGQEITTQSDLLSVNTGLPDQNSMTIALSEINPEARNIIGQQVTVTTYLADSFNNPVPDGTTVNFTSEGGSIESTCNTISGSCSVIWKSAEPFEDNHRVTILAYAIGHESFVDVNGNNFYDNGDGVASTIQASLDVSSGFGRSTNLTRGFIDMSEAWVDDNEDRDHDSGEQIIDANNNKIFNARDNLFNGPQCEGSLCAPESSNSIFIRKAAVVITSGSTAKYRVSNNSTGAIHAANFGVSAPAGDVVIARGSSIRLRIQLSDSANQTLPVGTSVSIAATSATLIGPDSITIANTIGTSDPDGFGGLNFTIDLLNELEEADKGELTITVTSPSGVTTEANLILDLL